MEFQYVISDVFWRTLCKSLQIYLHGDINCVLENIDTITENTETDKKNFLLYYFLGLITSKTSSQLDIGELGFKYEIILLKITVLYFGC